MIFSDNSAIVDKRLASAEGKIVSPVGMNDVPVIEPRGPVAQAGIAHGEHVEGASPGIVRLNSQGMTPGVIHVELHSAPRLLAEIDLERVVIPISNIVLVTSGFAGVVGIRLEEVDRVTCSRISGARGEVRTTDQVAEVG